jgi:hypothetical protein
LLSYAFHLAKLSSKPLTRAMETVMSKSFRRRDKQTKREALCIFHLSTLHRALLGLVL